MNKKLARKGYAFLHGEEAPECQICRLKNTCVKNLITGRRYTVKEVRDIRHLCPLSGEVALVEVEEFDIPFIMQPSKAFEGMTVTLSHACELCKNVQKCRPAGLKAGDRLIITKILGKTRCPKGQMTEVLVKRI